MLEVNVREIEEKDISHICDYWFESDHEYLHSLGVDVVKLPKREHLEQLILDQITRPYKVTEVYVLIWEYENKPIGHCNINSILYSKLAYIHFHIWKQAKRKKGIGTALVKKSLPFFFENFKLKNLYCAPYAHNPAPNKVLEKLGFEFLNQYVTTPGSINFEQEVKEWLLTREDYMKQKAE